jgi:periplasmic protein CpxP/Spy
MSTPNKSKIYILIISLLLLTNIGMLVFFMCNKGNEKKGGRGDKSAMMKEFLQKEVGFTAQQIVQYDTLSSLHKQKMKADFDALKNNKEQQFKELGAKGFSDSAIIATATQSAEKQKEMETNMLKHFAEIRKICTPQQQPKFDSLFYKIWNKRKPSNEKK